MLYQNKQKEREKSNLRQERKKQQLLTDKCTSTRAKHETQQKPHLQPCTNSEPTAAFACPEGQSNGLLGHDPDTVVMVEAETDGLEWGGVHMGLLVLPQPPSFPSSKHIQLNSAHLVKIQPVRVHKVMVYRLRYTAHLVKIQPVRVHKVMVYRLRYTAHLVKMQPVRVRKITVYRMRYTAHLVKMQPVRVQKVKVYRQRYTAHLSKYSL